MALCDVVTNTKPLAELQLGQSLALFSGAAQLGALLITKSSRLVTELLRHSCSPWSSRRHVLTTTHMRFPSLSPPSPSQSPGCIGTPARLSSSPLGQRMSDLCLSALAQCPICFTFTMARLHPPAPLAARHGFPHLWAAWPLKHLQMKSAVPLVGGFGALTTFMWGKKGVKKWIDGLSQWIVHRGSSTVPKGERRNSVLRRLPAMHCHSALQGGQKPLVRWFETC